MAGDASTTGSLGPMVRPYRESDHDAWERYVASNPAATFFHRIGWREIFDQIFRHRTHYLLAEREDRVVGVLPLVEIRSLLFGHSLVSLPFAVYGGPVAEDAATAALLNRAAVELGKNLRVRYLELRNRESLEPQWSQQDLYVTFRKDIAPDAEANLLAIPRKQRAMVRKGIQKGLTSEIDRDVERFYGLYADNQHRHGTPALSRKYFRALKRIFGDDCEVLTVLDPAGQPVSGVLSFYFRDEVLPYYAGDIVAAREVAANDFKYWELMRRACERGIKVFDYGRSKRGTGSFDFKRNWGFEPAQLHYEYMLYEGGTVPQNNPSNPKYRHVIAAWRRMPTGLVNWIGPMVARHLV